ncbi:HEAT repeat domain-containing protein [Candidatus Uabimicrobium sp. HlEnr_7]|uniref:HEAT repeat domain-containing protein n=1 Tax=Candidatus Uabimicrobium helgolandensis TaxID=3095367 RepID=UPI003556EC13
MKLFIICTALLFIISCGSSISEQTVNLKSTQSQDRVLAIEWLHNNVENDSTIKKMLEEALTRDSSPVVRSTAIRLMVKSKDRSFLPLIVKALDDKNHLVRMEAAQSVGSFFGYEYQNLLGEKLQTEEDVWVKLKIIKSLRYLRAKNVVSPLIAMLKDENPSVRHQALAALEKFTKAKLGFKHEAWDEWYKKQKPEEDANDLEKEEEKDIDAPKENANDLEKNINNPKENEDKKKS